MSVTLLCVLQGDTSALKSTNTWPLKQHAPAWLASDDVTAAMSHVRDGGGGLQLFGADCFDVTAGGGASADAGFQMSNSQSDPQGCVLGVGAWSSASLR